MTAADIADALDDGRIVARFRPLVDLATGSVSGADGDPGLAGPGQGLDRAAGVHAGARGRRARPPASPSTCSTWRARTHATSRARASTSTSTVTARRDAASRDTGPGRPVRRHRARARRRPAADRVRDRRARAHGATRPALAALTRLRLKGFGVSRRGLRQRAHARAEQLARLPLTRVKLAASLVSGAAGDARSGSRALEEALDLARGLGLVVGRRGLRQRGGLRPAAAARLPPRRGRVHRRRDAGRRAAGLGRRLEPTVESSASPRDPHVSLRRLLGDPARRPRRARRRPVRRHDAAAARRALPGRGREPPHRVVPARRPDAPELERPHQHGPAVRLDRRPALPRLLRRDPRHPRRDRAATARLRQLVLEPGAGRGQGVRRATAGPSRSPTRCARRTSRRRSSTPSTPRCAPRTTWRRSSSR